MMNITPITVTVGEITKGYVNNEEQGVRGYDSRLDTLPERVHIQREGAAGSNDDGAQWLSAQCDVLGETGR